ncbi:IS200/IS605 family transposase, partial [Candidatus Methanocrinis natronophilus]
MRSSRHSRYNINYHLVWIPKYLRPVLTAKVATDLKEILEEIAQSKGIEISGLEIMPDRIHLFISSPPAHAPSLPVNWFKGISAR